MKSCREVREKSKEVHKQGVGPVGPTGPTPPGDSLDWSDRSGRPVRLVQRIPPGRWTGQTDWSDQDRPVGPSVRPVAGHAECPTKVFALMVFAMYQMFKHIYMECDEFSTMFEFN